MGPGPPRVNGRAPRREGIPVLAEGRVPQNGHGRRGPVGMREFGRILMLPVAAVALASALMLALQTAPFMAHIPDAAAAALLASVAFGASLCVYVAIPRGRRILRHTVRLPRTILGREARA